MLFIVNKISFFFHYRISVVQTDLLNVRYVNCLSSTEFLDYCPATNLNILQ